MSGSGPFPAPTETMHFVQPKESAASQADALVAGTILGHYVIKKHIGGGGMGQVYLATDEALDRNVAIKVLSPQRFGHQGVVARFMNEARSAARLNHEHIAQVYFAGEALGIPFIAFEYVEGINIRSMVEKHDVIPLPQALNYLLQIAHALNHAASHNVVHRDVKPSNILITREGRAKLIDMGLARLLDTEEGRDDLTASGVTLGTFDYISPEQARDPRNADIRSDIYSLGCTFFFMLAGRPPFPEGTVLQKLLQHQGDVPPDIRSFQPSIPADVALLIQKMMAKDPRQRFQTPAVLIAALTDVARRLGLRQAEGGNLVWTPAPSNRASLLRRHLPWMAAVSLLLFGVLLMTIVSKQFVKPFLPPEFSGTYLPIAEYPPSLPESTDESAASFAVAFVSHAADPRPQPFMGIRLPGIGGRLQPAAKGMSHSIHSPGGRISVADLKLSRQNGTVQGQIQRTQVRCVDPTGETAGSYRTLTSALADAEDGMTIELKWNHVHPVQEPIALDRCRLNIVAAPDYHPILLFESSETLTAPNLFSIASSHVEFQRIGIEIHLNPTPLSHWSMFELSGNTRLTFEKCCLTIRNKSPNDDSPYHDNVVFFRNSIPIDLEGGYTEGDPFAEPLSIQITDSLLRGEAAAIQSDVPQDIDVECTTSLIALARPFLQVVESRRAARQAAITMRWDTMLFWGRQGVANLSKEITAESIEVHFESHRSVFILNRSPFVTFRGTGTPQKALEDFEWSGTGNYFQGVLGLRFAGMPNEVPLEDWAPDMREQTKVNVLTLNEITKPMSRYLPQDVRIEPHESMSLPDFSWFPTRWND